MRNPILQPPLLVEHHPNEPRMRVLARASFYDSEKLGRAIFVPKGFETDYASVPRALWWLYPPSGDYDDAAVVHDYLYFNGPNVIPGLTRKEADDVFLEALKRSGVSWQRRSILYRAVRIGGRRYWNKKWGKQ